MTDTQLDALDKLIAAVEAGEFDGQPAKYNAFARAWEAAFGAFFEPNFTGPFSAYCGSLDAALALHNALLPGWVATIWAGGEAAGVKYWWATVEDWNSGEEVSAESLPSPARAWLLAILKAYRAQVAG